jgi:hypothetical protein
VPDVDHIKPVRNLIRSSRGTITLWQGIVANYNLQKLPHQKHDVKIFFLLINADTWINNPVKKIRKNINKNKKGR